MPFAGRIVHSVCIAKFVWMTFSNTLYAVRCIRCTMYSRSMANSKWRHVFISLNNNPSSNVECEKLIQRKSTEQIELVDLFVAKIMHEVRIFVCFFFFWRKSFVRTQKVIVKNRWIRITFYVHDRRIHILRVFHWIIVCLSDLRSIRVEMDFGFISICLLNENKCIENRLTSGNGAKQTNDNNNCISEQMHNLTSYCCNWT